ncbi:ribose-phosphate diphosphokinase [Larkinella rosea]|uniref:Ribose-phosphate pyrophosphokinase n=1 Tax=Larkinella rosea TaxID=2025312 RepID=A0A3P1C1Z4_9BACT|nr:ribose-phosphate diphosphokinase [Larkinella rosea]RRB07430.1 ribose-phosphate pyrophosphokinase [Larkinella rosea]
MIYLHLSPGFAPYGPSIPFKAFTFNGGEPHLKLTEELTTTDILITTRLNSFQDVGLLLVATDALRRAGAERISLFVPYFPGARQDRVMIPGEPLTVKVYADLLNAQHYHKITVFDPHSDVAPALLNSVQVIDNHAFVRECLDQIGDCKLIAPDGGALKKIYKLSEALGGIEVVECSKRRDVKTGDLSGFFVSGPDLQGAGCVIVDDICDGGATFIGLADELKKHGAGDLYLIVSHGIFSKGIEPLAAQFKKVFTTDSIREINHPILQQISISTFLSFLK